MVRNVGAIWVGVLDDTLCQHGGGSGATCAFAVVCCAAGIVPLCIGVVVRMQFLDDEFR